MFNDIQISTVSQGNVAENAAPSKMQWWEMRDWKTWHHMTGMKNAGLEIAI